MSSGEICRMPRAANKQLALQGRQPFTASQAQLSGTAWLLVPVPGTSLPQAVHARERCGGLWALWAFM